MLAYGVTGSTVFFFLAAVHRRRLWGDSGVRWHYVWRPCRIRTVFHPLRGKLLIELAITMITNERTNRAPGMWM